MPSNININLEEIENNNDKIDNFFIAKIDLCSREIIAKSLYQAALKSEFTNNSSQSNKKRTNNFKFQKQLQGIICEIISTEYLKMIFKSDLEDIVVRHDDVRTDGFKSPKNEFDLKLKFDKVEFDIEVRSSISYKNEMKHETLQKFDVIGPYTNQVKKNEAYNDYYIRPILQLKKTGNYKIEDLDITELLLNDQFDFYITGGCTKDMMINNSHTKSMSQGSSTKYQVIPVLESLDIKNLTKEFRALHQKHKLTTNIQEKKKKNKP
jgi:hypothetical protein